MIYDHVEDNDDRGGIRSCSLVIEEDVAAQQQKPLLDKSRSHIGSVTSVVDADVVADIADSIACSHHHGDLHQQNQQQQQREECAPRSGIEERSNDRVRRGTALSRIAQGQAKGRQSADVRVEEWSSFLCVDVVVDEPEDAANEVKEVLWSYDEDDDILDKDLIEAVLKVERESRSCLGDKVAQLGG